MVTTPANGESNWPNNQRDIIIEFNEEIDGGTVNLNSWFLTIGGNAINGTITKITARI